jgi:Zn-finger nucleic acid-binding protein
MSDRQGVEIDYCPKCRGVWLDRGELDKIIEKSQSAYPEKRQDHVDDDYKYKGDDYKNKGGQYDPEYHKRRKKRGFLGDFFDFD